MKGTWKSDVDENVYGTLLLFSNKNVTVRVSFEGPIWKGKNIYGYREIYPIEINKVKEMLLDGIASYVEYIVEKNENGVITGSYHSSHPMDNGTFVIN